jgi:hypothetical protein
MCPQALVNYVALADDQKDIVLAFKGWAWLNLDRAKYSVRRTDTLGEKA